MKNFFIFREMKQDLLVERVVCKRCFDECDIRHAVDDIYHACRTPGCTNPTILKCDSNADQYSEVPASQVNLQEWKNGRLED
ncbi:MAG: hypothetical protein HY652_14365 [Acidobacteria bacterium]|nr:hypothetical protein [Acidobacteriota bacterium]